MPPSLRPPVVDAMTNLEMGLVADAAAPIIIETGIALAPLPTPA